MTNYSLKTKTTSRIYKKGTLRSLIKFYENLIFEGKVKRRGSSYNRMLELKNKYVNSTR